MLEAGGPTPYIDTMCLLFFLYRGEKKWFLLASIGAARMM
jgi:hypothetical protein